MDKPKQNSLKTFGIIFALAGVFSFLAFGMGGKYFTSMPIFDSAPASKDVTTKYANISPGLIYVDGKKEIPEISFSISNLAANCGGLTCPIIRVRLKTPSNAIDLSKYYSGVVINNKELFTLGVRGGQLPDDISNIDVYIEQLTPIITLTGVNMSGEALSTSPTYLIGDRNYRISGEESALIKIMKYSLISNTSTGIVISTGIINCPRYVQDPNFCKGGKIIPSVGNNSAGCPLPPTCEMPKIICPAIAIAMPKCESGKVIEIKDPAGCLTGYRCDIISCPQVSPDPNFCKGGKIIPSFGNNSAGCPLPPTCEMPKIICPAIAIAMPKCESGKVIEIKDPAGCLTGYRCDIISCPQVSPDPNFCKGGKIIPSVGNNTAGCPLPPTCEMPKIICPMYNSPSPDWCKDGTIKQGGLNGSGCQLPPTCLPKTCPTFVAPPVDWCKGGIIKSGGLDSAGCKLPPTCVKPECPTYSAPVTGWCREGTIVDGGRNGAGCPLPPVCVPKVCGKEGDVLSTTSFLGTSTASIKTTECCAGFQPVTQVSNTGSSVICKTKPITCPAIPIANPKCDGGKIVEVKDSAGCLTGLKCEMPKVSCPQYTQDPNFCRGGRVIPSVGNNEAGCPIPPTCEMPKAACGKAADQPISELTNSPTLCLNSSVGRFDKVQKTPLSLYYQWKCVNPSTPTLGNGGTSLTCTTKQVNYTCSGYLWWKRCSWK